MTVRETLDSLKPEPIEGRCVLSEKDIDAIIEEAYWKGYDAAAGEEYGMNDLSF